MIRLKELRTNAGLSQAEFAKIMRVAQNTVSNWENGNRLLDAENIIRISDFFGCTTDYLLGRVSHPTYEIRKAPPESGAKEYAVDASAPDLTVEEIQELRRLLQERNK